MKKINLAFIILIGASAGYFTAGAQSSVQELCAGSGVHCANLKYSGISMSFVKGKNEPGIRVKEK